MRCTMTRRPGPVQHWLRVVTSGHFFISFPRRPIPRVIEHTDNVFQNCCVTRSVFAQMSYKLG